MPLRPLPTPFKVGIDICSISRVKSLLLAVSPEQNAKQGPSADIRGENGKLEDAAVRRVRFDPIKSVSRQTNEHLAKMYRHLNPQFLVKLFRPEEIATLRRLHERVAGGLAHERIYQHVAGRWAAKEAIIKAASGRKFYKPTPTKVGFHDILIWAEEHGPVRAAIISEQVKDATTTVKIEDEKFEWNKKAKPDPKEEQPLMPYEYIRELDGQLVEISISHERDYAVATALIA